MREVGKHINLHSRDVMYSVCLIYHIDIFFIPGRDKRKQEQPSKKNSFSTEFRYLSCHQSYLFIHHLFDCLRTN